MDCLICLYSASKWILTKVKPFYTSNNVLIFSSPVINVALDFLSIYIVCHLQYTQTIYTNLKEQVSQDFWLLVFSTNRNQTHWPGIHNIMKFFYSIGKNDQVL